MKLLVTGASSGLGLGIVEGLPQRGDKVWGISRSEPRWLKREDGVDRHWIQADLAKPSAINSIRQAIRDKAIDTLVHCAGTWESSRELSQLDPAEIYEILAVNTASFVALAVGLADNLTKSSNGRLIAIGSTAGLDNATGIRAAYAASKFGIRGAVHALREFYRESEVGVTAISPGGLASDVDFDAGLQAALKKHDSTRIPTADVIAIIRVIQQLSSASIIKEIQIPGRGDLSA